MPGPTGLLPFQERFPDAVLRRRHRRAARDDGGCGHGDGRAAARSSRSTRPSSRAPSTRPTSTSGLHRLPVVTVLDRAGITGDDGPSHHGVLDLALCLSIPDMTVFAPSSAEEVGVHARDGAVAARPVVDPLPEDAAADALRRRRARGCGARQLREGDGTRVRPRGRQARRRRASTRPTCSWPRASTPTALRRARRLAPGPRDARRAALATSVVVTVEDGFRHGGAGEFLCAAIADALPRGRRRRSRPFRVLGDAAGLRRPGQARRAARRARPRRRRASRTSVRRALEGEPEAALSIPLAPHQAGPPPLR